MSAGFDAVLGNVFDMAFPVVRSPRAQHMLVMSANLAQRAKRATGALRDDLKQRSRCITEMAVAIELAQT